MAWIYPGPPVARVFRTALERERFSAVLFELIRTTAHAIVRQRPQVDFQRHHRKKRRSKGVVETTPSCSACLMYKSAPTKINPSTKSPATDPRLRQAEWGPRDSGPQTGLWLIFEHTKQNMAHFVSGTQTDLLARDLGKSHF